MKDNKIDVESLRLSQDFTSETEVEKLVLDIPIRRPNAQTFVRVHPDPAYQFRAAILKLKEENEYFLIAKEMQSELFNEIIPVTLFLSTTLEGTRFFWPNRLPGEDGRLNEWPRTERNVIDKAMSHWVRQISNRQLGGYEALRAKGKLPEPLWPQNTIEELLEIACGGRFIADHNHPVLKRLRGEL